MPATFAKDGAFASRAGGNDVGGLNTGIGIGSSNSGPANPNFTATAADATANHIGGGATASSAANTGNIVQEPPVIVAGSGYTNGTYRLGSDASGGQPVSASELELTISGGALVASRVIRAGSGFTSAPTFNVANARNVVDGSGPGAGTLATVTVTVGLNSRAIMLGSTNPLSANKGTRRLQAAGAVADGAVVSGGYLNRSGRAMVAGDQTWAVAP
jgi:hypothetical protein